MNNIWDEPGNGLLLIKIDEVLSNISREVCVQTLLSRIWPANKIKEKTNDLKFAIQIVDQETQSVRAFIDTYFEQYAKDEKNRLTLNESLCKKTSKTLKQLKQEFYDSRPRYKKWSRHNITRKSTLEETMNASLLNLHILIKDLFPYEEQGFLQCVEDLISQYMIFNYKVRILLRFCQDAIKRENEIRANPRLVNEIYNRCVEKEKRHFRNSQYYNAYIKLMGTLPPDELTQHIQHAINTEIGIATGYHVFSNQTVKDHSFYQLMEEGRTKGFSAIESVFWGTQSPEKVERIKFLISHLDDIYEEWGHEEKHKKISAETIALVMEYCKPFDRNDEKTFIEQYLTPKHKSEKRKYDLPAYKSIEGKKKGINLTKQERFNRIVDDLISRHSNSIKYNKVPS